MAKPEDVHYDEVMLAEAEKPESVPMVQFTHEPGAHNHHDEYDDVRTVMSVLFFLVCYLMKKSFVSLL